MTPLEFLNSQRIFTRIEFIEALSATRRRAASTIDRHLVRWMSMGRVVQVRRGLYVRARGGVAESVDPYGLANRMAQDAILGFHSALELHSIAQSIFTRLFVCTWTRTRSMRFADYELEPVRPRLGYRTSPLDGVVEMDRPDGPVRVTSLERTIVDVLDRPNLAGGLEESWRSLSSVAALDLDELERALERVARPVLVARVGFLLETMRERWLVPNGLLDRLEASKPRGAVYFDRKRKGVLAPRWNLIVPPEMNEAAVEGSSDEPI